MKGQLRRKIIEIRNTQREAGRQHRKEQQEMEERLRQQELEKQQEQNAAENSSGDKPAPAANRRPPTEEEIKACTCYWPSRSLRRICACSYTYLECPLIDFTYV